MCGRRRIASISCGLWSRCANSSPTCSEPTAIGTLQGLFRARAAMATRLLTAGYTQVELNALGEKFPYGADWLRPGHRAFNAPRAPWQNHVADLHDQAMAVALDLGSIATLAD
jgi:hypothetical protein